MRRSAHRPPPAPPTPTPSAAPKTKGGLLYSKIAAPPVGSADLSLSHGIDGVFTAKQITKQTFGSSKTEAATLATEEFVVAAGREYQREDGVGVRTFLLEFKNFYGAESLYDQVSNGRKAQKTVTGTFHVAGGSGFEWSKPDDRGDRWSEMYKRVDNIVIFLYVYTPGPISVPTDQKLLSVQVKLLA